MKNKAKKSSHQKNKVSKTLRGAVTKRESINKRRRLSRASRDAEEEREREFDEESDQEEQAVDKAPAEFDESAEWELEQLGGLSLSWGKRKVRNDDGAMKAQYYLKPDEEHRIWVKWTVAYSDGLRWSAEKQENLVNVKKENIKKALQDKMISPYPNVHEGPDSGWRERKAICQKLGYIPWKPVNRKKSAKYNFYNAEMPVTQSEVDDTEDEESDDDTTE